MKRLSLILLALVLCLGMLAGCGSKEPEDNNGDTTVAEAGKTTAEAEDTTQEAEEEKPALIKNEEDLKKILSNYSCEVHISSTASDTSVSSYKVHPDGIVFKANADEGDIMIFDLKNDKYYMLNEAEKTCYAMTADLGGDGSFVNPAVYLMPWVDKDYSQFKKSSSVSVDGRDATVYTYQLLGTEARYTVDKEYGFCLSYEIIQEGSGSSKVEIKNLQIGNVTEADITVPADYKVINFPS